MTSEALERLGSHRSELYKGALAKINPNLVPKIEQDPKIEHDPEIEQEGPGLGANEPKIDPKIEFSASDYRLLSKFDRAGHTDPNPNPNRNPNP